MEIDEYYLQKIVDALVTCDMAAHEDEITETLAHKVDWNEGWEKSLSRISYNAVKAASMVSVRSILATLVEQDVISVNVECFHSPRLTVLHGGHSSQSPHERCPEQDPSET